MKISKLDVSKSVVTEMIIKWMRVKNSYVEKNTCSQCF